MALTAAEKQAAYRERQRQEQATGQLEDEYVKRELEITRRQFDPGPEADREQRKAFEERIERSERYLRWRFREQAAGAVQYL
jgi:hypothetical protein